MSDLSQHPETVVIHTGFRSNPATHVRLSVGIEHFDCSRGNRLPAADAAGTA